MDEITNKIHNICKLIHASKEHSQINLSYYEEDDEEDYMKDVVFACHRYYELGKKDAYNHLLHLMFCFFKISQSEIEQMIEDDRLKT